jgi:putative flippase GtrA
MSLVVVIAVGVTTVCRTTTDNVVSGGFVRTIAHLQPRQRIRMPLLRQFLRFAAVGAIGTAVQYAILWLGVEYFGIPAAIASAIGFVAGSVCNYLLNYFLTFSSSKSHAEAATKYYLIVSVSFFINMGIMALLVHQLGWNYWLAQLIATGVGLIWNFAGSRWWAFKHPTT